jgi:molybdate transport repressor ModE-like protein
MLDLKRLRVLSEVARQGSFSAAANTLYLSQSAVSQQVATLEKEVGLDLLERTTNGPKLTDAGQVLVTHADAAIARLEEAEHEVAASFPTASVGLLTDALSEFRSTHPNVELKVTEAEPEESLPLLRAAEIDLAIVFDYSTLPEDGGDRDVERTLLLSESMYVALPREHPLAKSKRVPLAKLADEAWLRGVGSSSCGEVIVQACRDAGFEPRIAFESDEYQVLEGYVAAGLGFTLLPDLALPTLHHDLVVRPTEPEAPKRRVWAATRAKGARSLASEAMVANLTRVGESVAAERKLALAA